MSRIDTPVRTTLALLTVLLLASATTSAGVTAQEPGLVVTVDWLARNLDDVVLLHVGPEEAYGMEHIPGAVFVERDQMSHPASHSADALVLELPEADAFEEALQAWGVNDDSRIVVTFGDERVTQTARLLFTLDWAGLGDRTSYLDGGLTAWKAGGHEVTGETGSPARGNVTIRPRADIVVDAEWVQAHADSPDHHLVDARATSFFDGVREDGGVAGHIPGAGNVPWTTLVDEETLLLQPLPRLRELFDAAGVHETDTIVGYCHIGQYATLMLFTARLLGHEVMLYDGAFQDWAMRGLPAESGN